MEEGARGQINEEADRPQWEPELYCVTGATGGFGQGAQDKIEKDLLVVVYRTGL